MLQGNNGTGSSVSSSNIIRHADERSPDTKIFESRLKMFIDAVVPFVMLQVLL